MTAARPDDVCPRPDRAPALGARPFAAPIYPASVWACDDTAQAEGLLSGEREGYVYQRDGHPNADLFGEKIGLLHGAERTAVASSGMAALATAVLSQLQRGDHLLVSNQLYGRSSLLLQEETGRLGIDHTTVDPCDLQAVESSWRPATRMLVVETMANPRLRCVDIAALAAITRPRSGLLLVDNTFATPALCRPLELGADLVLESVSKMINGHSDVMLGVLCGGQRVWDRVPLVLSAWGLASSPFDCWLASRGLASLALRIERACANAETAARLLASAESVAGVDYPGLESHPDHLLAHRQFGGRFGAVVTFQLAGGRPAADRFISAGTIPFCPSLGEVSTTCSHPESTSHRGLTSEQREELGITGGTIRLSLGIESAEGVGEALLAALAHAAA